MSTLNPTLSQKSSQITTLHISLICGIGLALSACASKPAQNTNQRVVIKNIPKYHVVQHGESLSKIAQRYGLDYRQIASLNGLNNSDVIHAGQRLLLTNKQQTTKQTTQTKPNTQNTTTKTNTQTSHSNQAFPIVQTSQQWVRPVSGNLIRPFNQANNIIGNWYSAPQGTNVVATQAGSVIYVGNSLPEYGNLIMIQHSNDYISAYAHLGSFAVKEHQLVQAGQKIGTVGFIPLLNQPAVEFQVRYRGAPTNPNNLIK